MKLLEKLCLVLIGGALLSSNAYAERWITRDPMDIPEHMERDPHPFLDLNPYTFVGNNPIGRVDPLGLWWWDGDLIQIGGPQLLHDIFFGDRPPPPAVDPNSLLAQHGVDLSVTGGQPPGDFIADQAAKVAKDSAIAMSMLTPLGGEEGAYAAADKALGAAQKCKNLPKWIWPKGKGVPKMFRQMQQRGWTPAQITEAIQKGEQFPAKNLVNPANPAIRYVSPATGQSVVVDTVSGEVIHVGGPGFKY